MEAPGSTERKRLGRLLERLDSWQKAVVAVTALLVAIGGLVGAGVGVWHEVNASSPIPSASGSTRQTTIPTGQNPIPTAAASTTFSGTAQSSAQPQTPPPAKEIMHAEIDLTSENSLTYRSASGPQNLFTYYDLLTELSADAGVSLAVLDPPAPTTPDAGYARCQGPTTNTDTVSLTSLKPDSTLCAFTPNNQVFWISFLPQDPNSQSSALRLMVTAWQY